MFVVIYDLSDMPRSHRTFLRQRTMYVPLISGSCNEQNIGNSNSSSNIKTVNKNEKPSDNGHSVELKSYLRYLIHLR